jgi:hypothetical protein
MAQAVQYLLGKCKALSSSPHLTKKKATLKKSKAGSWPKAHAAHSKLPVRLKWGGWWF